jgi:hypothetical protein
MPEMTIQLKGWQAAIAGVILVILGGVRFATIADMTGDQKLMEQIDVQLMCDYYPDLAERIKAVENMDDMEKAHQIVTSVTTTKPVIEEVKASSPFLDFSSPRDVVVKVVYSLKDNSGKSDRRTRYYLFERSIFGWHYQYKSTAVSYYLNFM